MKPNLFLFECLLVFIFLLLPPLFSDVAFLLPVQPVGLYDQIVFCLKTVYAAIYEELLYRLYTPNRLYKLCMLFTQSGVSALTTKKTRKEQVMCFFSVEVPAVVLFALAHRYLGIWSVVFAAIAGGVFRFAYCRLTAVLSPAVSIGFVSIIHGLWNIGVYYYLWEHEG